MMQHEIPRIINDEILNKIEGNKRRDSNLRSNKNSSRLERRQSKVKLTTPHGKLTLETA